MVEAPKNSTMYSLGELGVAHTILRDMSYKVLSESLPTVGKISGPRICQYRSIHLRLMDVDANYMFSVDRNTIIPQGVFARFPVHIMMLRVHVT